MKVMEGLRYTLREIEAKRSLLRQGKADSEVSRYIKQHGNPPSEKLDPSEPPPNGYEIKEVLEYWPGITSIRFLLGTPSLIKPDRWLCLYAEQRQAQNPIVKYVKNGVEWTYPGCFEIDDKELEKLLVAMHPYARWKKDARKARPRRNPVTNRGDIGGVAIMNEDDKGKFFTIPIIVTNEHTQKETIWKQLLISAWGHGYFDKNGEALAYEQLKQYYKEDVLIDLLMHFSKHTFSPYNAITNMNYVKRIFSGYFKKGTNPFFGRMKRDIYSGKAEDDTFEGDELLSDTSGEMDISGKDRPSKVYYSYPSGSVLNAAQQTEVPEWTIWRLIRQGKLKAGKDDRGFVILDDSAINQLRQLASQKDKRNNIYTLAGLKGKNRQATKKWLQRHRGLTENEFQEQFVEWLNKTQNQKGGKPQ